MNRDMIARSSTTKVSRPHAGAGVPQWRQSKQPSHHYFDPQSNFPQRGAVVYGSYIDEPLALITPTQKYYYHANHLYSIAALTNSTGGVVERYRYDSFGNRTVLAPDGVTTRASSSYNQQVGFTGRYLDKETGLWYFRARYYSGSLGRFIGRDPLKYFSGTNLYQAYFIPNALDPSGMTPYEDCLKEKLKKCNSSNDLAAQDAAAKDCIRLANKEELQREIDTEGKDGFGREKIGTKERERRDQEAKDAQAKNDKTAGENDRIRELGSSPEPGHDSPGHDSPGHDSPHNPTVPGVVAGYVVESAGELLRVVPPGVVPLVEIAGHGPEIYQAAQAILDHNAATSAATNAAAGR